MNPYCRAQCALLFVALLALAPSLALAQGAKTATEPLAPPPQQPSGRSAVTWKLDNGLEVAFLRSTRTPLVSVQLWYRVGSKDEAPDKRGTARLLQLLAFEGSEHVRAGDHARLVRAYGGFVNAGTSEDATFFQNTVPAEYLDLVLRLEADRMRGLVLREPVLEAHRTVLDAELRRNEKAALSHGLRVFLEAAFKRHPYRWAAGGRAEDLPNVKIADVKALYDTYFVPPNALLVVVGAVEEKAVREMVQARFGSLRGGAAPARRSTGLTEPEQKETRRVTATPGQLGFVIHGYRIPPAAHDSVNALQLLSLVLATGESALLHKQLVLDQKLALQAGGQAMVRQEPGLFILLAAHDAGSASGKLDEALAKAVANAREKALPAADIERARRQLLANFAFAIETVGGLAGHLGQSWVLTQDPNHFWKDAVEFASLTPADLQKAAREHLTESNLTVVVIPTGGVK